jgi:hypothetical protein
MHFYSFGAAEAAYCAAAQGKLWAFREVLFINQSVLTGRMGSGVGLGKIVGSNPRHASLSVNHDRINNQQESKL